MPEAATTARSALQAGEVETKGCFRSSRTALPFARLAADAASLGAAERAGSRPSVPADEKHKTERRPCTRAAPGRMGIRLEQ
jgi:hypothetical protein